MVSGAIIIIIQDVNQKKDWTIQAVVLQRDEKHHFFTSLLRTIEQFDNPMLLPLERISRICSIPLWHSPSL